MGLKKNFERGKQPESENPPQKHRRRDFAAEPVNKDSKLTFDEKRDIMKGGMYSDGPSSSKRRKVTSDNSRGVLTVDSLVERLNDTDLTQASIASKNREREIKNLSGITVETRIALERLSLRIQILDINIAENNREDFTLRFAQHPAIEYYNESWKGKPIHLLRRFRDNASQDFADKIKEYQ